MLLIRTAQVGDADALGAMLGPVFRAGETYALPRNLTNEAAAAYWLGTDRYSFVAEENGCVLGTYYLKPNQQGGGAHVANAGYVTAPEAASRGIARQMCEHSLATARARGFKAMQFNLVVSSNTRAIALWQRLGFETVGRLPGAFDHPALGYVDALVMYRTI